MMDMIETAELLAFARVVEAKSLTRAAAELAVPRATLGRRITHLEKRLGTRLLRRTSRTLTLTEPGERFYRRARILLDSIAQAEASVRSTASEMRGNLKVSVPLLDLTRGAMESFHAMVTSFAHRHRNVRVEVDVSSRRVDLVREGYDVALRATYRVQPGLIARTVERNVVIAVASPAYLEEHGTPRSVKDLRRHRCLTPFADGEFAQAAWPAGRGVVHVESSFASNDLGLLREAAVRGLGIALLPKMIVEDMLERGRLVQVLVDVVEAEHHVAIVFPQRELLPAHVRAFIDSLVEWAPALHHPSGQRGQGHHRKTARNVKRAADK